MKSDHLTPPLKTLQRLLSPQGTKSPKYQEEPTKPRSAAVHSSGESHAHVLYVASPNMQYTPAWYVFAPPDPSLLPFPYYCLSSWLHASLTGQLAIPGTSQAQPCICFAHTDPLPEALTTQGQGSWNQGHGHLMYLLSKYTATLLVSLPSHQHCYFFLKSLIGMFPWFVTRCYFLLLISLLARGTFLAYRCMSKCVVCVVCRLYSHDSLSCFLPVCFNVTTLWRDFS